MQVLIVFYSSYGHVYRMAEAVAQGAREEGAEVTLCRVPETLSEDVLKRLGSWDFQQSIKHIPEATADDLARADAVIFGTPTRFGNMCAQMKQFIDATGSLWAKGALVGKAASVFTSTGTQHGGQESTLLSFHIPLLHHGMVLVGLPYSFQGQTTMQEISGCSPYGATTIAGGDGSRMPSDNELAGARFQGRHVAHIAAKLRA